MYFINPLRLRIMNVNRASEKKSFHTKKKTTRKWYLAQTIKDAD